MKQTARMALRPHDHLEDARPRSCLVLDANQIARLALDGPALQITLHQQSHRLFPLRRIARIHVIGPLDTGFATLLHCAEQQIPVAFFNTKGALRCQLYYPVHENGVLAHWLEHIEFDEQAAVLYQDWLQLQHTHLLARMGCRQGAHNTRTDLVEQHITRILKTVWSKAQINDAQDWLDGLLTSHLSQLIAQEGLAHQSRGTRRLLEDLLPSCKTWLLYCLTQHIIEQKKAPRLDAHGMSQFYQHISDSVEYLIRRMLVQLVTRLESII